MAGNAITAMADHLDGYAQAATFLRVPFLESQAEALGAAAGFPPDQIKYLLGMLAVFPLSLLFTVIPAGRPRHAFSMISGLFLAQFVFGAQWIHPLVSSMLVYLFLAATANVSALDRVRHVAVFVFMMTYMSFSHIYRIYIDYMGWSLDFTGAQMLLTIKLTAFAYNLYDGTVDRARLEELAGSDPGDDRRAKKKQEIAIGRLERSIDALPGPIEYFGYVFCFASFLAGPAFEVTEYLAVTNGVKFQDEPGQAPPARAYTAVTTSIQALVFLALMVVGSAKYPMSVVYDPEALEAASTPLGFLRHIWLAWVALFFMRCKYYFGWLLAEGGAVTATFGYQGRNKAGQPQWRGVRNIDVWGFEFANNIRAGSRAWNQCTQTWLERYVYWRTNGSEMATYFVSAFWHGFYPGYYMFFLSVPLASQVAKLGRKRVRPLFVKEGRNPPHTAAWWLYEVLTIVLTSLTMNYLATVFQVLSWERSLICWTNFYFCGHVLLVIAYVLIPVVFAPVKPKTH